MTRLALSLWTALVASGCARPTPARPSWTPATTLHLSPLADLVPAGGLRWLVDLRPTAILSNASLIPELAGVLPERELDAMARAWGGVDLRATDQLVAAGYDAGTIYLAHQAMDPVRVEAAFTARVAEVQGRAIDQRSDDPGLSITRLWGSTGRQHEAVVLFGREAAGLAVGSEPPGDALLRAPELFALARLKRARPAWRTPPLDRLGELLGEAPVRVATPGPFEGASARGLGGLLAAGTAAGVALDVDRDHVHVTLVVTGAWGDRAAEATDRLRERYDRLVQTGLGRLVGLDRPATPPVMTATPDSLRLEVGLATGTLLRGIRDATTAQVADIMQWPEG